MPCYRSCGGGTVTPTASSPQTNAVAAQREATPYAEEKASGGVDWLGIIGDAISAVGGWIMEQLKNDENLSYATVALGLRQTWIGPYPISVVDQEALDYSGDVTRYPIENRDELADHIHNEPKKITVKAWLGSPLAGIKAVGAQVGGGNVLDTSPFWQAKTLMIQLAKLQRDRIPVFYVSGLQIIPNVVVTRFRPMLKAPHANAMMAEIVLEQVKFGKSPEIKEGVDLAEGTEASDGGTQNPSGGDKDKGEGNGKDKTWLGWVIDAIGKWLGGK